MTPKAERLIRLYCSDCFGAYSVIGKWVLYKKKRKGQTGGRFMMFNPELKEWMAQVNVWKERESWEYLKDKKP